MAHVKRFDDFRKDKNYNRPINELFNSKKKQANLENAKAKIVAKLDELEEEGVEFDREAIMKKAESNKFRGSVIGINAGGKKRVIYKDGLSNLQKIASGTGAQTLGENVDSDEEDDMVEENFEEEMTRTFKPSDFDFDDEVADEEEGYEDPTAEYEEEETEGYEEVEDEEDSADFEEVDFEVEDDMDMEDLEEAYKAFESRKALKNKEAKFVKELEAFSKKGFVVNEEVLLKEGKENSFAGKLTPVVSKRTKKIVVKYK